MLWHFFKLRAEREDSNGIEQHRIKALYLSHGCWVKFSSTSLGLKDLKDISKVLNIFSKVSSTLR